MGKYLYPQYYENIILNNIISFFLFVYEIIQYNDIIALMLLCILYGS